MRVGQFLMHRNPPADELPIQRIRIVRKNVGVPAGPLMTRMIRLWMDFRRDRLEVQHDLIAAHENPKVVYAAIAAALYQTSNPSFDW